MSPGSSTENYLTFAHIGLRENLVKNLNQVTCPDQESNPGHLVSRPDALTVTPQIWMAKRDEVTGEWRKLHNAELHALYSSPDVIRNIKSRRLRWTGHVAGMGESRNAHSVLVGRPEGKRSLGKPRRRWEDNIKMDLREVGYDDREWINLAQDRYRWRAYVRATMNLREGKGTRDAIELLRTIGERYLEKNKEVYVVFVDLEKAFDRVDWNKLMGFLKKIGVDWKERRLFSNLYMKQRVKVRIGEEMSEGREIGRGVR
ncbi:hypothetical protein ANN_23671 [Periplaneta americana]|uniref:Reverse transcriptase domain-containing protein n=1 Tax=Periplaneta americana TaxID=6978 RepID=A0ABQ8SMZ9_PERAM|nr:hypothetical protein ANN_23671 [Periplaneta americana]